MLIVCTPINNIGLYYNNRGILVAQDFLVLILRLIDPSPGVIKSMELVPKIVDDLGYESALGVRISQKYNIDRIFRQFFIKIYPIWGNHGPVLLWNEI